MTEDDLKWLQTEFVRCAPWLQAALDRDAVKTHELSDVWSDIEARKAQFWPSSKSAIVTCIEFFPRITVLRYWLCGGELKDCVGQTPEIEAWFESWAKGPKAAAIGGRRGWMKKLPGYREAGYYLVKDIP